MSFSSIQCGFASGEMSPRLYGRTDLAKYALGCSTMRNFFVDYRGGASSRAGLQYVGMCKQGAPNAGGTSTNNFPRDIPFQFSINQGYVLEFGDIYMRIKSNGAYVTEATNPITNISKANPAVFSYSTTNYSLANGDWIFVSGVTGMTNFNGLVWVVTNLSGGNFNVTDLFGNSIDSTLFSAYISGGTLARIYTPVSPYAAIDLPFLKYTQSADTMTLTCINQNTLTEYPSYELVRNGATNWVFTADSFASSVPAPTNVSVTANSSAATSTYYSYVVTSVGRATGEESVASPSGTVRNNDIAINAGSNVITWTGSTAASSYNIYSATPSYLAPVPVGSSFGYIGSAFGTQFTDTNIIADFTVVPPVHNDPFSRGQIASVSATAFGGSYTQSSVSYNFGTTTGSGGVIVPVVVSGEVVSYIVQNGGKNYPNNTIVNITDSGSGHGATAIVNIGPQSGTYPGTCVYFQQRRAYAYSINNPDTYWMSQPGSFNNMDSSVPTTDSDSIVGNPWAQQINGIQFMVPMPGGLIILTGKGAWQLNGGTSAAITPADQTATPQAYNGCNSHIQPIVVNYDIIHVQSKGSIVRDLSYNLFSNIYTGTDMTVLSDHLFDFHQLQQWAYAEEPFKIIWCVRDDGTMLSFTYLKEQDVYGWARHDTNGIFVSSCSVTEPPIDAVYIIAKRYIQGQQQWAFYSERMDNRNWQVVEDSFCVDAGLSYPMTFPNTTLMPAAADGTNNISATNVIIGGSNYTSPLAVAQDLTGKGNSATFLVTVVGGVITAVTPSDQGQNYTVGSTEIIITDPTGSGAIVNPIITNNVVFNTSDSVFSSNMVGNVIRIGNNDASLLSGSGVIPNGGGKAIITSYVSGTEVVANIIDSITNVIPDDPENTPVPVSPNYWSISIPTDTVGGLNHLEGMEVAILADGNVVPNQVVANGSITLPTNYSAITVGLPYTCQLQTLYLNPPNQPTTAQGKRKDIQAVTARVQNTRGISIGTNQPDAATQPNGQAPAWTNMYEVKQRNSTQPPGTSIPFFTGDLRELIGGNWAKPAQIAVQQTYPLPCNLLALIPEWNIGDTSG